MPSEVALEKIASATLMAIVMRLLVLNGSSSYVEKSGVLDKSLLIIRLEQNLDKNGTFLQTFRGLS